MSTPTPIQTYYVPLPEADLIEDFDAINDSAVNANGAIQSLIALAVAAPGTVIWYDHWEDGYDVDYTSLPAGSTTHVWGDGDLTNDFVGAAAGLSGSVTGLDAGDVFGGGEAIILENLVDLPRDPADFAFDGSDRIVVSFPVAVTRGAYPNDTGDPGSLMAGAVEVFATNSYGTEFLVPVGEDTPDSSGTDPFQRTSAHVMAAQDGTVVELNGAAVATLNAGENVLIENVDEGDEITATEPVQVSLVAGDVNSTYEMRWYALAPREDWSNDYVGPLAEETGSTGFWFHNPNDDPITLDVSWEGTVNAGTLTVAANSSEFVEIDTGFGDIDVPGDRSGIRFTSQGGEDFFALSQIDADGGGQAYDWGHPLIPVDDLTSQALIGLGYGNTTNDDGIPSYSRVFVTPVADATINIDFDGDGTVDAVRQVDALDILTVADDATLFPPSGSLDGAEDDQDMSGAVIFATEQGDTTPVNIAVAWGQDPSAVGTPTTFNQENSLDLGTVVPPLPEIIASKSVSLADDLDGDGQVDPGDQLEWTIQIQNFGLVPILAEDYQILDNTDGAGDKFIGSSIFEISDYDPGSTSYIFTNGGVETQVAVADSASGTLFPLDETGPAGQSQPDGFVNTDPLGPRVGNTPGEIQFLTFTTTVKPFDQLPAEVDGLVTDEIVNIGELRVPGAEEPINRFSASAPIPYQSEIRIEKSTNGEDADLPADAVPINVGAAVTWTYRVTLPLPADPDETNVAPLADVTVVDDNGTPGNPADDLTLGYADLLSGDDGDQLLEPGETWVFEASDTAGIGLYSNVATATGTPVFPGDPTTPVPGVGPQTDTDPSNYFGADYALSIDKTVIDVDGAGSGGVVDAASDVIGYQIVLGNEGNAPLTGVVLTDALLEGPGGTLSGPTESLTPDGVLEVGETWTYAGTYAAQQSDIDSNGGGDGDIDNTATADSDQTGPESDSEAVPLDQAPALEIDKRVAGVDTAGNGVLDVAGDLVEYEIDVTNAGNQTLTNVTVTDPLTGGLLTTLPSLAVGETATVPASYALTQADLDSNATLEPDDLDPGLLDNTATADSDQTGPESDSEAVPVEPPVPGSISGVYFCDKNGDSLFNGGDTTIPGKQVTLLGLGADGVPGGTGANADTEIASTTTAADGTYAFADLEAGAYAVEFEGSGNRFVFKDVDGDASDEIDSDVGLDGAMNTGLVTDPIDIDGTDVTGVNAGIECFDANEPGPGLAGAAAEMRPTIVVLSAAGTTTYDAGSDLLTASSRASFAFDDAYGILALGDQATLRADLEIDDGGELAGGVDGPDVLLFNDLDQNGTRDGGETILLQGEVRGFGYQNGQRTDVFDAFFEVTGGSLSGEFSQFIALSWSSEASSFAGSFAEDFEGSAKGTLGSTDLDCIC